MPSVPASVVHSAVRPTLGTDEADGHGEEGEIAEKPERALARQFVGAFVFRDEIDRMTFDYGFVVEDGQAGAALASMFMMGSYFWKIMTR